MTSRGEPDPVAYNNFLRLNSVKKARWKKDSRHAGLFFRYGHDSWQSAFTIVNAPSSGGGELPPCRRAAALRQWEAI